MLLSVLLGFLFLIFWLEDLCALLGSFKVFSFGVFPSFEFMVDPVSLMCCSMLFCCGLMALFYCFHYFGGESEASSLFPLIVWFLSVMGILIFTSSFLFSLVLWEYLGLVSYFLILFYSKSASLRASIITLFASRFGDVALFLVMMWFSWYWQISSLVFVVLFLLVVMTKSACFPFVSWLLEAMRAPTPVSSLVHSSTLVAAGIWFLLRYKNYKGFVSSWGLLYFCLITVIMTSFSATVFMDLKKIVALSTCKKVSWCMIFFVCGDLYLSLLQLMTHGVCKCYLFMSVGDLMSQSGSSQSAVGVYLSRYSGQFLPLIQGFLIFSLCGLPFMGVFFSKHFLFSGLLYSGGVGLWVVAAFSLMMSYVYSVRFALLLLSSMGGLSKGYSSVFLLMCPLVFMGTVINLLGSLLLLENTSLGLGGSALILVLQVFGCVLGYSFYYRLMGTGRWCSLLWGCEGYVSMFYKSFMKVSNVCMISFYRWEVYLLKGLLGVDFRRWLFFRGSLFSLKVMILGLFFVLVFSYIFS